MKIEHGEFLIIKNSIFAYIASNIDGDWMITDEYDFKHGIYRGLTERYVSTLEKTSIIRKATEQEFEKYEKHLLEKK